MDYRINYKEETKDLSREDVTWKIHYVTDDSDTMKDYMCDCHTHGLEDIFGMELQIVLKLPMDLCCYVLNSIGYLGLKGYRFAAEDKIYGLFQNIDMPVRIILGVDANNGPILRVWMPDEECRVDSTASGMYGRQDENPYR